LIVYRNLYDGFILFNVDLLKNLLTPDKFGVLGAKYQIQMLADLNFKKTPSLFQLVDDTQVNIFELFSAFHEDLVS